MTLPLFYEEDLPAINKFKTNEESSRHITQVLRMKEGEQILITNGKGHMLTAQITSPHKKNTEVNIIHRDFFPSEKTKSAVAVSLIKNTSRFEWFIEKATEIGISAIIPLLCSRTEKTHFRRERMQSIIISAMLQSRQVWLPELWEPVKFDNFIKTKDYNQKFIAHCIEEKKVDLKNSFIDKIKSRIILIGPEGDFTEEEIREAIQQNYIPVSLGNTRLRTETAGILAAVLLV